MSYDAADPYASMRTPRSNPSDTQVSASPISLQNPIANAAANMIAPYAVQFITGDANSPFMPATGGSAMTRRWSSYVNARDYELHQNRQQQVTGELVGRSIEHILNNYNPRSTLGISSWEANKDGTFSGDLSKLGGSKVVGMGISALAELSGVKTILGGSLSEMGESTFRSRNAWSNSSSVFNPMSALDRSTTDLGLAQSDFSEKFFENTMKGIYTDAKGNRSLIPDLSKTGGLQPGQAIGMTEHLIRRGFISAPDLTEEAVKGYASASPEERVARSQAIYETAQIPGGGANAADSAQAFIKEFGSTMKSLMDLTGSEDWKETFNTLEKLTQGSMTPGMSPADVKDINKQIQGINAAADVFRMDPQDYMTNMMQTQSLFTMGTGQEAVGGLSKVAGGLSLSRQIEDRVQTISRMTGRTSEAQQAQLRLEENERAISGNESTVGRSIRAARLAYNRGEMTEDAYNRFTNAVETGVGVEDSMSELATSYGMGSKEEWYQFISLKNNANQIDYSLDEKDMAIAHDLTNVSQMRDTKRETWKRGASTRIRTTERARDSYRVFGINAGLEPGSDEYNAFIREELSNVAQNQNFTAEETAALMSTFEDNVKAGTLERNLNNATGGFESISEFAPNIIGSAQSSYTSKKLREVDPDHINVMSGLAAFESYTSGWKDEAMQGFAPNIGEIQGLIKEGNYSEANKKFEAFQAGLSSTGMKGAIEKAQSKKAAELQSYINTLSDVDGGGMGSRAAAITAAGDLSPQNADNREADDYATRLNRDKIDKTTEGYMAAHDANKDRLSFAQRLAKWAIKPTKEGLGEVFGIVDVDKERERLLAAYSSGQKLSSKDELRKNLLDSMSGITPDQLSNIKTEEDAVKLVGGDKLMGSRLFEAMNVGEGDKKTGAVASDKVLAELAAVLNKLNDTLSGGKKDGNAPPAKAPG